VRDLHEELFVLAIHARGGYHQAMQLAPAGDRAVLVELGDVTADELHAVNARVREVPGVVRSTPGHSSLYVIFEGAPDLRAIEAALNSTGNGQRVTGNAVHEIPVAFDGADFAEFLVHARVTREEFLSRVVNVRLIARYLGFRGGFAYLDGWPAEWAMPRRATSRPVARGSFAIAGNVAGFYPIDTPGGWNVLGRTDVDLENAIAAGDEVSLRVVESSSLQGRVSRRLDDSKTGRLPFEITAPLAKWTDTPFDDIAAALANRAVGNDPRAAILECPMVGPRIRFTHDAVIAWCTPDLNITTEHVKSGDERAFGRITNGLRAYLAIGGAGFQPAPAGLEARPPFHVIRAMNGPHDLGLTTVECEVTPQLDRVGIRLRPLRALDVRIPADLKSIGMQCGTVQLHPDGSLVAMGPDHPVTGGYLQPMTVLSTERWKLAQLAPGERITFVLSAPPES
jgi:KipI family sensor histidine kinase inhibitor